MPCDTSAVGIGTVLFHRYEDEAEQPIAYASRSLTQPEKNYIEREALSIIYGVKKFHQYLYGRIASFLLLTDHTLLLTIFGEKKVIPVMAASRLQGWLSF